MALPKFAQGIDNLTELKKPNEIKGKNVYVVAVSPYCPHCHSHVSNTMKDLCPGDLKKKNVECKVVDVTKKENIEKIMKLSNGQFNGYVPFHLFCSPKDPNGCTHIGTGAYSKDRFEKILTGHFKKFKIID